MQLACLSDNAMCLRVFVRPSAVCDPAQLLLGDAEEPLDMRAVDKGVVT